jgi:hypothetical protein
VNVFSTLGRLIFFNLLRSVINSALFLPPPRLHLVTSVVLIYMPRLFCALFFFGDG